MHKTAYDIRISDWSSDVCSSDLTSWPSSNPVKPYSRSSIFQRFSRIVPLLSTFQKEYALVHEVAHSRRRGRLAEGSWRFCRERRLYVRPGRRLPFSFGENHAVSI